MKRDIRRTRGRRETTFRWPHDPTWIKSAGVKGNLKKGLKALEKIWELGYLPKDLKAHYLMTWYAYSQGNVVQLSKLLGVHRNTFNLFFWSKFRRRTIGFRLAWKAIFNNYPRLLYPRKVGLFIQMELPKLKLPLRLSSPLVNLWLMGIPLKVVRSHYILWSLKEGRTGSEICKMMGVSIREMARYRGYAVAKESPTWKWLAPLKPTLKDWFPYPWVLGRVMKNRV